MGIDRNLRNVTVGNAEQVTYYDVSKVVEIAENTRSIVRSFKRNDVRIRREIAAKYGRRRRSGQGRSSTASRSGSSKKRGGASRR